MDSNVQNQDLNGINDYGNEDNMAADHDDDDDESTNFYSELEEKNQAMNELAMTQKSDELIHTRVQQLALVKVLINIHKRD